MLIIYKVDVGHGTVQWRNLHFGRIWTRRPKTEGELKVTEIVRKLLKSPELYDDNTIIGELNYFGSSVFIDRA